MLYVCLVPGKEKMRWYLDWIRDQLLDLNVDIRLNHAPTVDELRGFDLVLNATGAVSYVPAGRRRRVDRVVPFEEAMACPKVACECHPGGRKMRKLGAARPALGRQLRRDRHRGLARGHRQAGHDRDREPGVRGGLRGHPHVRPAQALRAGRRRGPPLAAVQAPGDGDHVAPRSPRSATGAVVLQDKDFNRTDARGRRRRHVPHPARDRAVHGAQGGRRPRPQRRRLGARRGTCTTRSRRAPRSASRWTSTCCSTPTARSSTTCPMDVLAQLTREDGPSYTAKRMLELAGISSS